MVAKRRTYSTECMISHVPAYRTEKPEFYRCSVCGSVYVRHCRRSEETEKIKARETQGTCCGHPLVQLQLCRDSDLLKEHEMKYCIFGGSQHNTIRVEVSEGRHSMSEEHHIEWLYLHTFQGGQMKYLFPGKGSFAMFSMAQEDAYAFCGREICHMGWEPCHFQCKRGHVAYAYCNKDGLFELRF